VKSDLLQNKITFDELIERLKTYIRLRINNGEYTERSLARVLRVSQPHLHNMLKGNRRMSAEFADQAMAKFRISILDLIGEEEIWHSFDDKNPDWLEQAAKRKPAATSPVRQANAQPSSRTGS
jgi:plasmid maintenance system antidote protein VapI